MPSVLKDRQIRYLSNTPYMYKGDLELKRIERLDLIWRISNRVWHDYLERPSGCEQAIWNSVTPRFTVTDLQTPVIRTITSASHGGKVTRFVNKCKNPKEVSEFIASPEYDSFIKGSWNVEAVQYGTAYGVIGFRNGKMHLTSLPPVATQIITPEDDYEQIDSIVSDYGSFVRSYEAGGIYRGSNMSTSALELLPDTNFGFIPVSIAKGDRADCASPYGMDMVWPATQETVQVTYLMNDTMILERLQSFSTLVIKGAEAVAPKDQQGHSPFAVIRLSHGAENDAKYISPEAAIDQIDRLIASKFERAAVQCQVPVDVFTKSKAGANQSAGSSHLQHKPLYDLVVKVQEQRAGEEKDLIARIDAAFSWLKNGKNPVDLEDHIRTLDVDISYERETNPSFNMADAQTYEMLISSRLIKHRKAFYKFNPDGTEEDQQELEALRESDRAIVDAPAVVGDDNEEEE